MLKSGGEHGVELEGLPPGSCAGDRLARKVSSLTQPSDQGLQIHRHCNEWFDFKSCHTKQLLILVLDVGMDT